MKSSLKTFSGGGFIGVQQGMQKEIKPIMPGDPVQEPAKRKTKKEFETLQAEFEEAGMLVPPELLANAAYADDHDEGETEPEPCDCKSKKVQPLAPVGIEFKD